MTRELPIRRPLEILWRGPLDSCNYSCSYCPFAKREPSQTVLQQDQQALERFVAWVTVSTRYALRILFTPYGEALIWPWYRQAITRLSTLDHVEQVSIQTNASGPMDFADRADLHKVSLWISWHPTEIARIPFAEKIRLLKKKGLRFSVGAVAQPQHLAEIEALRKDLPTDIPMWLNAEKPGFRYPEAEQKRWKSIDPEFDYELRRHHSHGKACTTGTDSISVDGEGEITRCHFVKERIGNLYTDDLESILVPAACQRKTCECWIGYLHLVELGLSSRFPNPTRLARIRATDSQPTHS